MNPEGSKTVRHVITTSILFESSVNPEGSKTEACPKDTGRLFESSVNPEGSKTTQGYDEAKSCLRVV